MQYFDGKLKGDLSNVYTDFINCDIGKLGWIGRKYPDSYSIVKRKGYTTIQTITDYECTDILEIDGGRYYMFIKSDRTKIKIYKLENGSLTELYSNNFKYGLYERFTRFNFVKGTPKELFKNETDTTSNTGIENKCINGDWLSDSNGKDFNTDTIIPSDYLYVYDYGDTINDNTGIPGQSFIINNVSTSKIGIDGNFILGNKIKGNDMSYCVLPYWGEVFGFATSDGYITWHSDSFFTKGGLTPTNIGAVEYHQGVLNFLTDTGILFISRRGCYSLYVDILSQIYVGDYFNLVSFNNYLVLFSKTKIGIITLEDEKTIGYIIPTLYSATSSYGIYDKYSFVNYEDSVYIATNYKRIASIDIIPSGTNKFKINRTFQQYFDGKFEINSFNKINIKNTDQKLYVFTYDGIDTNIYIYDQYYKIWIEHNVKDKKILNYYFNTDQFYGDGVIKYIGLTDDGVDYVQEVKGKILDDSIETIKKFHILKLGLGPNTGTDLQLILYNTYNGKTKINTYTGIENINTLKAIDTLGDNNLGDQNLGNEGVIEKGYIQNIEYDIGYTGELLNFNIKSTLGFELISFIVGYDVLQPHITEIGNVYLFNN